VSEKSITLHIMDKKTRINEIINIELDGISRTIREYSTDQFVISYAEKLGISEFRNNPIFLRPLIERIKQWYENQIEEIKKSQYVQHKDLHQKSYDIILELSQLLNE